MMLWDQPKLRGGLLALKKAFTWVEIEPRSGLPSKSTKGKIANFRFGMMENWH